nr:MAG TPA: hypothetical protein [Caudoviricetes sp.]
MVGVICMNLQIRCALRDYVRASPIVTVPKQHREISVGIRHL